MTSVAVTGCAHLDAPASAVDADGRHWVKLSSDEPLLDELRPYIRDAGCTVLDGAALDVTLLCSEHVISLLQLDDTLVYQCPALDAPACDELMSNLAPPTRWATRRHVPLASRARTRILEDAPLAAHHQQARGQGFSTGW
jgi:hypothetical protein